MSTCRQQRCPVWRQLLVDGGQDEPRHRVVGHDHRHFDRALPAEQLLHPGPGAGLTAVTEDRP